MAKHNKTARESSPTRLYTDTLRLLRVVSEWRGVTMADFVDEFVKKYLPQEAPDVMEGLAKALGQEPKAQERKGAK
jgi:hypothetical protein